MSEEKVMVDTQGFLTSCPRFAGSQLSLIECEKCHYHVCIEEVWPGKDRKPYKTKAIDMNEGTALNSDGVDTDKPFVYDRICGLPTRSRTTKLFKFADNTEE